MRTRRNSQPQANQGPEIVTASNLKAAYRKVHRLYGDDAVISRTRTVVQRSENGLGQEKMVEVTVGGNPGPTQADFFPTPAASVDTYEKHPGWRKTSNSRAAMVTEISTELDRIDNLVGEITLQLQNQGPMVDGDLGGSVGRILRAAGTRLPTVNQLMQRFTAETGQDPSNRPELMAWLVKQIPAANCPWDGFFGCHAFLGYSRSERQELVLKTSARFRELNRSTLVLALFPDEDGIVQRLQSEAAEHGFDAAIIRREEQIQRCEDHFEQYDVVLLELPDLDSTVMASDGAIHDWLARNSGFHRHLVMPMNCDIDDLDVPASDARHWNCDWLALTRADRVTRRGKLLDILEKVPLPVSLSLEKDSSGLRPVIGNAGELLDGILAAGAALADEGSAGLIQFPQGGGD